MATRCWACASKLDLLSNPLLNGTVRHVVETTVSVDRPSNTVPPRVFLRFVTLACRLSFFVAFLFPLLITSCCETSLQLRRHCKSARWIRRDLKQEQDRVF
ncbi:hypothetical protein TRVL_04237 [Trypanosoma vivax]|nr:hypothetical protein TRVL_04237 [Trypanosoma vivax]